MEMYFYSYGSASGFTMPINIVILLPVSDTICTVFVTVIKKTHTHTQTKNVLLDNLYAIKWYGEAIDPIKNHLIFCTINKLQRKKTLWTKKNMQEWC